MSERLSRSLAVDEKRFPRTGPRHFQTVGEVQARARPRPNEQVEVRSPQTSLPAED